MKKTILAAFLTIGFVVAVTGALPLRAQDDVRVPNESHAHDPDHSHVHPPVFQVPDVREIDGPVLVVEIKNVLNPKGILMVGVFDKEEDYTGNSLPQSPKVRVTKAGTYVVEVKGLEPGTYAVVVYHDWNENKKLDKNFVGIPQEPYAFSNHPLPPRGAPKFETSTFILTKEGGMISVAFAEKQKW